MDIKKHIQKKLGEILAELKFENPPVVKLTDDSGHGDYYSNVAMQAMKQVKTNIEGITMHSDYGLARDALDMANKIKTAFVPDEYISKVEAVSPGFINFWVSEKYLLENLSLVSSQKDEYGKGNLFENKKVIVEFTDPNPLKEFHIGHLYSNAVGESLSRLFENQKAEVWRVCYQGDVGLHVAKALYGIMKYEPGIEKFEDKSLSERAKFLGEAYALGATEFEKNEQAKEEIIELNKKVYDKNPEIYPLYEKAKGWSLEYFETLYKRLGTKFDHYYFESDAGEKGLEIVRQHMGEVFTESDGAVVFDKEKSGLHTRVFINSQGLPTYETKELGLAPAKYEDFAYDTSVIITGNEVNDYFKVLLKALSLISPDLASKTTHISHGMVRLPSGKMSSRTGDVITGDSLLFETEQKISKEYREVEESALAKIAVAAIKYTLLKTNIGHDVTFNFEESISLNGNSGPYLQYTYVRTQSVLKKAGNVHFAETKITLNTEELNVLRLLSKFTEIAIESSQRYSPNLLATYLFELCQAFNLFYQKHSILEAKEGEDIVQFRLLLTQSVGQVIKNGLNLLGIETVEKM